MPTPSPADSTSREDQIRELAKNLMPADDIALLVGMDVDERRHFVRAVRERLDEPYAIAYHQGRLATKNELHKTVVLLAVKGSPAAQPMAEHYLLDL